MRKQRQAVGERGGGSKTISSTPEETDKEEKGDRHSPTGAARRSRRTSTTSTGTRAAAPNTHALEASEEREGAPPRI